MLILKVCESVPQPVDPQVILVASSHFLRKRYSEKRKQSRNEMASTAFLVENEALEELFCNICCGLPKQKIFQCRNGHSLCAYCHDKCENCPYCRRPLDKESPIRNLFFEEQVEKRTRKLANLEENECAEDPEDYDCPICFNLPEEEVFQCKNGHPLCAACHQQLKICPQCKGLFDKGNPIRNLFFEEMLDKYVKVDCAYKLNGCDHRPTRKLVQDHLSKCHFNIARFGKLINLCNLIGYEGCDFCVNNGNTEDAVKHFIFQHGCVSTEANHLQMELSGFNEVTKAASEEIFLWTPVISDLNEKKCFLLTSAIYNRNIGSLSCFSICIPKFIESLSDLKIEYSVTGQRKADSLEWKLSQSCIPLNKAESFLPRNLLWSILPENLHSRFTKDGNLVINCIFHEDQRNNSNGKTESKLERIVCPKRPTSSNFLPLYYFEQQREASPNAKLSKPENGLIKNAEICVKDLPEFATKEYIKNFFSEFGKVVSVKMIPQTRSTGKVSKSCTVCFENRSSIHKVIEKKDRICMKRNGKKYRLDITAERLTINTESEANWYLDLAQEACLANRDALMEYIMEAFSLTGDLNLIQRLNILMTFLAANYGSLESLKYCIEKGIDAKLTESKHSDNTYRPINLLSCTVCDAYTNSGLEKAKYLVENGADIHFKHNQGLSLLHYSVMFSTHEMVKFFLDNGLEVNECDFAGCTALHAAFLTDIEIKFLVEKVKILLDHGANLSIKDNEGRSPLTLLRLAPAEHRDQIKEMFGNHLKRMRDSN